MAGETDLKMLLAAMTPELLPGVHVFATLVPGAPVPETLNPVMLFREKEGTTLILPEDQAAGLQSAFRCRMITLNVHSSLEAVGFLAAIPPGWPPPAWASIRSLLSIMTICSCPLSGPRKRWSYCANWPRIAPAEYQARRT